MGELGYSWGPVCLVCIDMAVLSLLAQWLKTHTLSFVDVRFIAYHKNPDSNSWVVLAIVEGLPFRVV